MGRFAALLGALLRDRAGNALGITLSTILLLLALTGSGTDISRAYMTRTSLQNACDAAVLAGRKAMAKSGTYGSSETAKANKMFNFNFNPSVTDAKSVTFTTAADTKGAVNGTAATVMPTTIMAMFGFKTISLSVTCSAELQMASADVLFVLDTTGSMACNPDGTNCTSSSTSKIQGVRDAVRSFYKTVAGAVVDPTQSRIRFAFVPYSQVVNVGGLVASGDLPTSYFADTVTYNTKLAYFNTPTYIGTAGTPVTTTETYASNITQTNCNAYGANTWPSVSPTSGGGPAPTATTTTSYSYLSWVRVSGTGTSAVGTCKRNRSVTTTTYVTRYLFTNWRFTRKTGIDVSAFKGLSPAALATSFDMANTSVPTAGYYDMRQLATMNGTNGVSGVNTTNVSWSGCAVEKDTVQQLSMSPVPSGAYDLDLESAPTNDATRWKLYMTTDAVDAGTTADPLATPTLNWGRGLSTSYLTNRDEPDANAKANDVSGVNQITNTSTNIWPQTNYCPARAMLFTTVDTTNPTVVPSWLDTYVNGLVARGGTYHDIGMLWAGRIASPTGIFSSNVNAGNLPSVSRHLIFMTDGTMDPTRYIFTAYGTEYYDNRIAPAGATSGDTGTLAPYHNNRFLAICDKIKNMGYTIWVIGFGQTLTTPMQTCATANRAYYASNTTELTNTFKFIAGQVADLRINK